ncbi:MAG TPA: two-component regulator propeller domain-containing protein [Pyrinomonadaceae bacterium]|nr:two-component regulator propeller domain-containing protein [Pyrinomonadaceae bacterium]
MSRSIFLLFLIAFSCQTISAQYHFDSWTTDNGLPQNGVRTITQSPDGYLWFTTFDGLVRFDGVKFEVFNKSNSKGIITNRFWVIKGMPDGSIWVGTEDGDLTIYRNRTFTSYPADKVPDKHILAFQIDADKEVLIETETAFYKLENDNFVFIKKVEQLENQKIVYQANDKTRWEIYPNETFQIKEGQKQIYPVSLKNLSITDYSKMGAFEDKSGGLWFADFDKLVYLKDGKISEYGEKDGYPQNIFAHRLWQESDGSLWFATGNYNFSGVGLVRFKDGKLTKFGIEHGLSNDRIFDVFKDREGTIWLATDKGLNQLRPQIITSLSKADGLVHNETYPILQARDGSIYIGTVGGLSHYQDGKFTNTILHPKNDPKGVSIIQSLYEAEDGRLWVGTIGSFFVIENGKPRDISNIFDVKNDVMAIIADKQKNLWFATQHNGIYQYRDEKLIANYKTGQGLASNDVKVIYEAKDGTLWFGTYGGISVAKCGSGNTDCKFKNYTIADGLGSNLVRSIAEDADGTMWFGTYDGGLSRFKEGRFFNFNTENGLYNNGVFAIMEDNNGNFWMSSNKGIFRVNKQQLNDFADGKISGYESFAYGKQDGMLNTECNGGRQPSAIKDKNGKIWFPTLEGAAIVDPTALSLNPLPPPVEIENIAIDRENITFNETVTIQPSQTQLDINYTALSFIKSDQIRFQYKLEGLDKDWVDAGTRRTVNYSYLPSGDYVFRVIATNTDGVWNTEGKSLKIIVLAPFYKTLRFWLAIFFAFVAVAYLIYRYRINQLRKLNAAQEAFSRQLIESQEAERKRIAQELHDSLGQNLLVIKNRALLGLATEDKDEQFGEIQESVTDALSEVRTIAYNLRPLHIERLGLSSTIEEMVENVEAASGIQINYDIAKIDNLFTPENEINFYRIVQECLNNIVKHSKATKASVEVFRENENITLNIRDNGSGFNAENMNIQRGLGLNGIAERVKILGGTYSIESEIGKGTTILVKIEREKP